MALSGRGGHHRDLDDLRADPRLQRQSRGWRLWWRPGRNAGRAGWLWTRRIWTWLRRWWRWWRLLQLAAGRHVRRRSGQLDVRLVLPRREFRLLVGQHVAGEFRFLDRFE